MTDNNLATEEIAKPLNEEQSLLGVQESEATEPKKEPKKWPDSANKWTVGKTVQLQDLQEKTIKSALVVNYAPNYLVILKVGGAFNKLKQGIPVKVGDNVFFVAQREPKRKLVGLFYVCNYTEAKEAQVKSKETPTTETLNVVS